jgi:hypothetical protein
MRPFVALVTPLGDFGGPIDPGFGNPGGPGGPGSPGGPGGPGGGLGIWGGPFDPPRPTHPIAPGGRPPGIWGGAPPYVDIGGPGPQPTPTPPIYFPPPGSQPPLGIWGGKPPPYVDIGGPAPQPRPEHPIVLPPDLPAEIPPPEGGGGSIPIEWKTGWTEQTGWIIVGVPEGAHPTPSK